MNNDIQRLKNLLRQKSIKLANEKFSSVKDIQNLKELLKKNSIKLAKKENVSVKYFVTDKFSTKLIRLCSFFM
jgi:hypothetical protein